MRGLLTAGWARLIQRIQEADPLPCSDAHPPRNTRSLSNFHALLVGSKVAVAWLVAKGRRHLTSAWYRRVLRLCGGLLLVVGLVLIVSFPPLG